MKRPDRYLTFKLDERLYAISLSVVERIIHAVEITPLPDTSDPLMGAINMGGETLGVIDIRTSLNMPKHQLTSSDRFIILNTKRRRFALITDSVEDIHKIPEEDLVTTEMIWEGLPRVTGTITVEQDIIPVLNIELFFSQQYAEKIYESDYTPPGEIGA